MAPSPRVRRPSLMSVRVGTDIVEVERFRTVLDRRPGLRQKLFTDDELAYCDSQADPAPHLAARFSAKEALSKAIGTGIRELSMIEIEVTRNEMGKPGLVLWGRAKEITENLGIKDVDLSISHSHQFVVAVVVIEI